jgi:hypothetical protein
MKRSITIALLALSLFTIACSTTMSAPQTPTLSGLVTAVEGNTITITPNGGSPTTVTLIADTNIFWPGGAHALPGEIAKGHNVNVWLKDGTQTATRINIGF